MTNEDILYMRKALDVGMAVPVVAACCLVSHLLRVSPVFTFHLFGRRT